jgi:chromate transporter
VRSVLQTLVIASAALLPAAIPLGLDGLTGPIAWATSMVCLVPLLTTKIDTLWRSTVPHWCP